MAKERGGVAKLVVALEAGGVRHLLFSRKRAKGTEKHRLLEFLGGNLDDETDPLRALIKELEEEEKSGLLAQKVESERPPARILDVNGTPHYVFSCNISFYDYLELRHGKKESFGFKLVPETLLADDELHARMTSRTRAIVDTLGDRL